MADHGVVRSVHAPTGMIREEWCAFVEGVWLCTIALIRGDGTLFNLVGVEEGDRL